jgi:hypothetical protein
MEHGAPGSIPGVTYIIGTNVLFPDVTSSGIEHRAWNIGQSVYGSGGIYSRRDNQHALTRDLTIKYK